MAIFNNHGRVLLRILIALEIAVAISLMVASTIQSLALHAHPSQLTVYTAGPPLSGMEVAAAVSTWLFFFSFWAGLIGLWWCQAWARFLFTAASLLYPALIVATMLLGGLHEGPDSAGTAATVATVAGYIPIAAILVQIWFRMSTEFGESTKY